MPRRSDRRQRRLVLARQFTNQPAGPCLRAFSSLNPIAKDEIGRFMREHEPEPEHVHQVAGLAVDLFDQLSGLHGLGAAEREWLEAASLLHDIGWSVVPDGKGHHKESARLIMSFEWLALGRREAAIIAQIGRYHRKSLPDPSHEEFMALAEADRQIVEKLAGVLRIADGLDRQHLAKAAAVQVTCGDDVVTVTVAGAGDLSEELAAAAQKSDLAERVFGRRFAFAAA